MTKSPLSLASAILLVTLISCGQDLQQEKLDCSFNQSDWVYSPMGKNDIDLYVRRECMIDDVIDNVLKVGMEIEEVEKILGVSKFRNNVPYSNWRIYNENRCNAGEDLVYFKKAEDFSSPTLFYHFGFGGSGSSVLVCHFSQFDKRLVCLQLAQAM